MKLQELQELFTNDVITSQGSHPEALLQNVRESRGVCAKVRLDIYRSNVEGIHLKALDDTFPVVAEVLGERYWHQLLRAEINNYGSPLSDLNNYGMFIPELLKKSYATREELSDFSYLSDLARLELVVRRTLLCKNDQSFDWKAFKHLTPEAQSLARLITNASLSLFQSVYPVDALWYSHQDYLSPQIFEEAPDGIFCCIYRYDGFKVTLERLARPAAQLLERLTRGVSLNELQTDDSYEPDELIRLLFSWIDRGWIVGYDEGK